MKRNVILILLTFCEVASLCAQNEFDKRDSDLMPILSKIVQSSLRSSTPSLPTTKPDSTIQFFYSDNVPNYKTHYQYDAEGNQTLAISLSPSYINPGEWENNLKEASEYDNEGNLTKFEIYEWKDNEWHLYKSRTYTYSDGVLTSYTTIDPDFSEPIKTIVSTGFDIDNGRIVKQTFLNIVEDNIYQESYRYDYSYNDQGFLTEQVYSNWDYAKQDFAAAEKDVYLYEDGTLVRFENYLGGNEKWFNHIKYEFSYDLSKRISSMSVYHTDDESNEWKNSPSNYIVLYYPRYSDPTGVNAAAPLSNANIWADNQTIHIESETDLASVNIFNLNGQLVYSLPTTGKAVVMETPVENGIYLVEVKDMEGKSKTTKLVIY